MVCIERGVILFGLILDFLASSSSLDPIETLDFYLENGVYKYEYKLSQVKLRMIDRGFHHACDGCIPLLHPILLLADP